MVKGMSVTSAPEEGWDVLVTFRNRRFILYQPMKNGPVSCEYMFGAVRQGAFDLTVEDAMDLGIELITAASNAMKTAKSK